MVKSSNFDEAPPVPPAYGSWVTTGDGNFRSTYLFFTTAQVDRHDPGAGWAFSGSGKLHETITLSPDANSYTSRLSYELFDATDKPLPGQSGSGHAVGRRIVVEL
jgi:hypothetical protein